MKRVQVTCWSFADIRYRERDLNLSMQQLGLPILMETCTAQPLLSASSSVKRPGYSFAGSPKHCGFLKVPKTMASSFSTGHTSKETDTNMWS